MATELDLVGFAKKLFEGWPDNFGSLDGMDLQELAEEFGLLTPREVTAPCTTDPEGSCFCREYHGADEMADGVTCYVLHESLRPEADPCEHTWGPTKFEMAVCTKCGYYADSWYCPASTTHLCQYDNDEDPAHDNCVHCGQPEERK